MSVRLLLEGPDLQEILGQAREAYGPTVRVVQAEQVRSGGLGGFFAKQHYEVTVEVQNPGAGAPGTGNATRKAPAPGAAAVSSQNDQALASAQARVTAARAAAFSAADLAAVDDVLAAASYEDGPAPARPARQAPAMAPVGQPLKRGNTTARVLAPVEARPHLLDEFDAEPKSRRMRKSGKGSPTLTRPDTDSDDDLLSDDQMRRLNALLNQPAFADEVENERVQAPVAPRPGQAVPWQPIRLERNDVSAPAHSRARRGTAATEVPRRPGQVLVLIGEALQGFKAAHQIATSARIPTTTSIVVTQTEAPLPGVPSDRQVSTMAEARRVAAQVGRDKGPVIFIIDAPISIANDPNGRAWIRDVVKASQAHQVWAVVDATRQTATLTRWVRAVGEVSALVVHDAASADYPEGVYDIGLPVVFRDGLAVDNQVDDDEYAVEVERMML